MSNVSRQFPGAQLMEALQCAADVFLAGDLPDKIKPKRAAQIDAAYGDLYRDQLAVGSIARRIEVSHLLGCNEVVAPIMVEEYVELTRACTQVLKGLDKLKAFQELNAGVKTMREALAVKPLGQALAGDLKTLDEHFSLGLDIGELMGRYKEALKS